MWLCALTCIVSLWDCCWCVSGIFWSYGILLTSCIWKYLPVKNRVVNFKQKNKNKKPQPSPQLLFVKVVVDVAEGTSRLEHVLPMSLSQVVSDPPGNILTLQWWPGAHWDRSVWVRVNSYCTSCPCSNERTTLLMCLFPFLLQLLIQRTEQGITVSATVRTSWLNVVRFLKEHVFTCILNFWE